MLFLSMKIPVLPFSRYVLLAILISHIRQTLSAVLPSRNTLSLYTANDKITILTKQNFSSTVYDSKTAWLIEFYASWCGHCQSYANTYREVGIDTLGWKTVVRIGAINCYAEDNNEVCEQHNVMAYPTLRLIPPHTFQNTSRVISLVATSSKDVERELIKELDSLQRTDAAWPRFSPVNESTFDDLYNLVSSSIKLVLVIVEKRDDYTGRQIMLDFSRYHEQLAIFRATIDGKLWENFHINITDIPALFAILPDRTAERINIKPSTTEPIGSRNLFNYAIRSYIHQRKSIDNFDDRDLEEIVLSRNALKNADSLKNEQQEKPAVPEKVNMLDLETALSYMFRREIPRMRQIHGEPYAALIRWINVLVKYFPGREPVMNYLKEIQSKLNEQPNGITGKQFRELAEANTANSYLPNNFVEYRYCTGSAAQYRGYPCALWLLFHTLTVSQARSATKLTNVIEVPSAVKDFIQYFFGCRHCSDNFMKETENLHKLHSRNQNAAVLYLWKIHNHVNQRLHGDETEDPQHPKVQFPPSDLCPTCHTNEKNFDVSATLDFLLRYYSKENLDLSSVGELAASSDGQDDNKAKREPSAAIDKYSMIEINDISTEKSGFFGSIASIIRRFPVYFLIVILILAFFARKRYCKQKRKRYTL